MEQLKSQSGIVVFLVVAVVALVIVGGGVAAYVATDGFKQQPTENGSQQQSQESQSNSNGDDMSLTDKALIELALNGGASIKCDYSGPDGSGTAYIKDKNMRVDYTTPEGAGHMITLENEVYFWSADEKTGMKIVGTDEDESWREDYESFDPEEYAEEKDGTSVDCQPDNPSNQLFQVPGDVEFTDIASFMRNTQ